MKHVNISLIFLFFLIVIGFGAPLIAPHNPQKQILSMSFQEPSISSPMGRDALGRDILSRVLYGIRTSLFVGFSTVVISLLIGVTFGGIAGYFGGFIDIISSRIIDMLMAFPGLLLSIGIAGIMGPSTMNIIIALCSVGWVGYARYTRAMIISVKHSEYILSAKAIGKGTWPILVKDILPNILEPIIVEAGFGIGVAIVSEASLSFLGLSSPSTPSLGRMLAEAISVINVSPWMAIFPGLTLTIIVLLFNDIGEDLRKRHER